MALDPYTANMSAEAAARSLGVDNDEPSAALEYARGTGLAQLALAIGVNRLADAVENFVGGAGPRPGLDELTGSLDRVAEAIGMLST